MCINVEDCAGCTSGIFCYFQKRGKKYQTCEAASLVFVLQNPTLLVIQVALESEEELEGGGPDVAAFALVLEEQPHPVLSF